MPIDPRDVPEPVRPYAAAAADYVWNALRLELEFHEASLSVLDHYLARAREEEGPIRDLVAAAVGCFFGEFLRRSLGGTWHCEGGEPAAWELELPSGVVVRPVGMAAEALALEEVEGYDGSVYVPDEHLSSLRKVLDSEGPVAPERYYSLVNRYEVLQGLLARLTEAVAAQASRNKPSPG